MPPTELQTGLLRPGPLWVKRIIDIALAAFLAVLALPVGLLIGLAIVLESRGPVFFAHMRIGKGGRRFRLWKFRSMVTDGDEVLRRHFARYPERAVEWQRTRKLRDDPRVTLTGRFLRRRSLDELPQLWNVLKGDMSMVGPRPVVEDEVQRYGQAFALYRRVSPGLTGLWQVSGRNNTSYRLRVELDSAYVRTWTPWLDLRIILKTVRVVLGGHGAY